ncbi:unnamed protein product [Ectocarpus fasciculatus]
MRERQRSPLRLGGRHPCKSSRSRVLPRKAVQARNTSSPAVRAASGGDVSGTTTTTTTTSGNQPGVPAPLQQASGGSRRGGGGGSGGGGTTRRRSRGGGGSPFPPGADDETIADMAAEATTPVPDRRNSAKGRTSSGARGSVNRSAGATPPSGDSTSDPSHNTAAASGSANGKGRGKSGAGSGSSSISSATRANGTKGGHGAKSGSGARGGSSKGGNANHLLNFQFQPIANVAGEGGGGGRARRGGGGGGGGSSRSKGGGGGWGGGATRGPMSKEQFLQANFHFLLHNPAWAAAMTGGDARSASPGLQEAFFDPDVLVDWDTVDTVRLFRRVSRRKQAVCPPAVKVKPSSTPAAVVAPPPPPRTGDASGCLPGAAAAATAAAAPKEEGGGSTEREGVPHGFKRLTVLRGAEEVSWGSSSSSSSSGKKPNAAATAAPETSAAVESPAALAMPEGVQSKIASREASPRGDGATDDGGAEEEEEVGEEEEEGGWTCPICLGVPVAPRVTKCGHGPFCLVCILRHLNGEASARCPLCFDKMQRSQLRRAACQDVRPYVTGGTASLVLLKRERSSLVPVQNNASDKGTTTSGVPGGATASIPGGGSCGGGPVEDGWAAGGEGVCPAEGDESERFSRLVRAAPSTLRDLAAAEQMALLSFRHSSIASGETEWVPYISQAQALVKAQLDRFSGVPPSTITATASGSLKPTQERAARGPVVSGGPVVSANPPRTKSTPPRGSGGGGGGGGGSRSIDSVRRVGAGSFPVGLENGGGGAAVGGVSGGSGGGGGGGNERESLVVAPETAQPSAKGSSSGDKPSIGTTSTRAPVGAHGGGGGGGGGEGGGGGPFRFFQSVDGQKAFLHPLDMRQLLDDAEKGLPLPPRIDAKVLEVDTVKLTPDLRKRLPFLGHLPIHCDISFLEVDMSDFVSDETSRKFREDTQKRERKRRSRAAQEARLKKEEARLEQDRADRIAAMRAFTVDLQGPTPGGAEQPPQQPPRPPQPSNQNASSSSQDDSGDGAADGGPHPATTAAIGAADASSAPSSGAGLGGVATEETATAASGAPAGGGGWSFARITAMNGHFPTLKPDAGSSGSGSMGNSAAAAWGGAVSASSTGSVPVGGSSGGGVWGGRGNGLSSGTVVEPTIPARVVVEGGGAAGPSGAGKKKGRKGKAVSLFSNAGVRGGSR